ncbi:OTU domain-containing protein 2 [Spathaspora sp. JA1]|nr:OTU domain-containing protein 2 [Spathaspora sp. JA1]
MSEQPPTKEELIQRHKKESKDLIATITGLKKQATKKTRKNVNAKCEALQQELDIKHKQELAELEGTANDVPEEDITPEQLLAQLNITEEQPQDSVLDTAQPAPKKKNRQQERLNRRKAEIERIRVEAAEEAANTIDYRQIEIESMNSLLSLNNLYSFDIKPDGHCLFASIQDQLKTRRSIEKTIQELRDCSGEYIKSHQDDFIPFLFDESTGSLRDLDDYVKELTTTAMWGSDMEILALANTFECPISVYMAGASTITINPQGEFPELKLGYYKHSYGLGEHYNSLRDLSTKQDE